MIELDGSLGEGGGQILRSSLSLALLTGKPFRLRNIRAGRAKPGLQPQHLMSVRAAAEISGASLRGASLGSSDLVFEPGAVKPGSYRFSIRTAGATALVLHTIYLPLSFADLPSDILIEGGTHVSHAPCFHFLESTWQPYLQQLGFRLKVQLDRPGFYPRGGGSIRAHLQPVQTIAALQLLRASRPTSARVVSIVAGLPEHVAVRQAKQAKRGLEAQGLSVVVEQDAWPGGPGSMLAIELDTKPVRTFFFALGERGKSSERVADDAVKEASEFLNAEPAGIDEHSADQLLLPLAMAQEPSTFRVAKVSSHLLTNADVVQRFLPRGIVILGEEGGPGQVEIG